ncbi:dynein axonemal heavy chain [Pycnococcus provasolii]
MSSARSKADAAAMSPNKRKKMGSTDHMKAIPDVMSVLYPVTEATAAAAAAASSHASPTLALHTKTTRGVTSNPALAERKDRLYKAMEPSPRPVTEIIQPPMPETQIDLDRIDALALPPVVAPPHLDAALLETFDEHTVAREVTIEDLPALTTTQSMGFLPAGAHPTSLLAHDDDAQILGVGGEPSFRTHLASSSAPPLPPPLHLSRPSPLERAAAITRRVGAATAELPDGVRTGEQAVRYFLNIRENEFENRMHAVELGVEPAKPTTLPPDPSLVRDIAPAAAASALPRCLHCVESAFGDPFARYDPYSLTVVPASAVLNGDKHAVVSSNGIMSVEPGVPTDVLPLEEWLRHRAIFLAVRKLPFYAMFPVRRPFHHWRDVVRLLRFRVARRRIAESALMLHPVLGPSCRACAAAAASLSHGTTEGGERIIWRRMGNKWVRDADNSSTTAGGGSEGGVVTAVDSPSLDESIPMNDSQSTLVETAASGGASASANGGSVGNGVAVATENLDTPTLVERLSTLATRTSGSDVAAVPQPLALPDFAALRTSEMDAALTTIKDAIDACVATLEHMRNEVESEVSAAAPALLSAREQRAKRFEHVPPNERWRDKSLFLKRVRAEQQSQRIDDSLRLREAYIRLVRLVDAFVVGALLHVGTASLRRYRRLVCAPERARGARFLVVGYLDELGEASGGLITDPPVVDLVRVVEDVPHTIATLLSTAPRIWASAPKGDSVDARVSRTPSHFSPPYTARSSRHSRDGSLHSEGEWAGPMSIGTILETLIDIPAICSDVVTRLERDYEGAEESSTAQAFAGASALHLFALGYTRDAYERRDPSAGDFVQDCSTIRQWNETLMRVRGACECGLLRLDCSKLKMQLLPAARDALNAMGAQLLGGFVKHCSDVCERIAADVPPLRERPQGLRDFSLWFEQQRTHFEGGNANAQAIADTETSNTFRSLLDVLDPAKVEQSESHNDKFVEALNMYQKAANQAEMWATSYSATARGELEVHTRSLCDYVRALLKNMRSGPAVAFSPPGDTAVIDSATEAIEGAAARLEDLGASVDEACHFQRILGVAELTELHQLLEAAQTILQSRRALWFAIKDWRAFGDVVRRLNVLRDPPLEHGMTTRQTETIETAVRYLLDLREGADVSAPDCRLEEETSLLEKMHAELKDWGFAKRSLEMLSDPAIERRHILKLLQDLRAFIFTESGEQVLVRDDATSLEVLRTMPAFREGHIMQDVLEAAQGEHRMQAELTQMRENLHGMTIMFADEPSNGVRCMSNLQELEVATVDMEETLSVMERSVYLAGVIEAYGLTRGDVLHARSNLQIAVSCQEEWSFLVRYLSMPGLPVYSQTLRLEFDVLHNEFRAALLEAGAHPNIYAGRAGKASMSPNESGAATPASHNVFVRLEKLSEELRGMRQMLKNLLAPVRAACPRLFLIPDDELLMAIASLEPRGRAVNALLPRVLGGVESLATSGGVGGGGRRIVAVHSAGGEAVELIGEGIFAGTGRKLEEWLDALIVDVRKTLSERATECMASVNTLPPDQWIARFPLQCITIVDSCVWTQTCSKALRKVESGENPRALKLLVDHATSRMASLGEELRASFLDSHRPRTDVRHRGSARRRETYRRLISAGISHRDVASSLAALSESGADAEHWNAMFSMTPRYYWDEDVNDCTVCVGERTALPYGFEYLGDMPTVLGIMSDRHACHVAAALGDSHMVGVSASRYGSAAGTVDEIACAFGRITAPLCLHSSEGAAATAGRWARAVAYSEGMWGVVPRAELLEPGALSVVAQTLYNMLTVERNVDPDGPTTGFVPTGGKWAAGELACFVCLGSEAKPRAPLSEFLTWLCRPVTVVPPSPSAIVEVALRKAGFFGADVAARKLTAFLAFIESTLPPEAAAQCARVSNVRAIVASVKARSEKIMDICARKNLTSPPQDSMFDGSAALHDALVHVILPGMKIENRAACVGGIAEVFGIVRTASDIDDAVEMKASVETALDVSDGRLQNYGAVDREALVSCAVSLMQALCVRPVVAVVGPAKVGKSAVVAAAAQACLHLPSPETVKVQRIHHASVSAYAVLGVPGLAREDSAWSNGVIKPLLSTTKSLGGSTQNTVSGDDEDEHAKEEEASELTEDATTRTDTTSNPRTSKASIRAAKYARRDWIVFDGPASGAPAEALGQLVAAPHFSTMWGEGSMRMSADIKALPRFILETTHLGDASPALITELNVVHMHPEDLAFGAPERIAHRIALRLVDQHPAVASEFGGNFSSNVEGLKQSTAVETPLSRAILVALPSIVRERRRLARHGMATDANKAPGVRAADPGRALLIPRAMDDERNGSERSIVAEESVAYPEDARYVERIGELLCATLEGLSAPSQESNGSASHSATEFGAFIAASVYICAAAVLVGGLGSEEVSALDELLRRHACRDGPGSLPASLLPDNSVQGGFAGICVDSEARTLIPWASIDSGLFDTIAAPRLGVFTADSIVVLTPNARRARWMIKASLEQCRSTIVIGAADSGKSVLSQLALGDIERRNITRGYAYATPRVIVHHDSAVHSPKQLWDSLASRVLEFGAGGNVGPSLGKECFYFIDDVHLAAQMPDAATRDESGAVCEWLRALSSGEMLCDQSNGTWHIQWNMTCLAAGRPFASSVAAAHHGESAPRFAYAMDCVHLTPGGVDDVHHNDLSPIFLSRILHGLTRSPALHADTWTQNLARDLAGALPSCVVAAKNLCATPAIAMAVAIDFKCVGAIADGLANAYALHQTRMSSTDRLKLDSDLAAAICVESAYELSGRVSTATACSAGLNSESGEIGYVSASKDLETTIFTVMKDIGLVRRAGNSMPFSVISAMRCAEPVDATDRSLYAPPIPASMPKWTLNLEDAMDEIISSRDEERRKLRASDILTKRNESPAEDWDLSAAHELPGAIERAIILSRVLAANVGGRGSHVVLVGNAGTGRRAATLAASAMMHIPFIEAEDGSIDASVRASEIAAASKDGAVLFLDGASAPARRIAAHIILNGHNGLENGKLQSFDQVRVVLEVTPADYGANNPHAPCFGFWGNPDILVLARNAKILCTDAFSDDTMLDALDRAVEEHASTLIEEDNFKFAESKCEKLNVRTISNILMSLHKAAEVEYAVEASEMRGSDTCASQFGLFSGRSVQLARTLGILHAARRKTLRAEITNIKQSLKQAQLADTERDEVSESLKSKAPELLGTSSKMQRVVAELASAAKDTDNMRIAINEEEARIGKVNEQVRNARSQAEAELAAASASLDRALVGCFDLEGNADLAEVRSFVNPPQLVKSVLFAVLLLLDEDLSWPNARRVLNESKPFFAKRLEALDRNAIEPSKLRALQQYVQQESFTPDAVAQSSQAARAVCEWVLAIDRYARTKVAADEKERRLADAEAKVAHALNLLGGRRAALEVAEGHVTALERRLREGERQQRNLDEFRKAQEAKMDQLRDFFNVLDPMRARWDKVLSEKTAAYERLDADTMLAAAAATYCGALAESTRVALVGRFVETLKRFDMDPRDECAASPLVAFVGENTIARHVPFEVPAARDVQCREDLITAGISSQRVVLLDADGEAMHIFMALHASMGQPKFVSIYDPDVNGRISQCVRNGQLIFVLLDSPRGPCPLPLLSSLRLDELSPDGDYDGMASQGNVDMGDLGESEGKPTLSRAITGLARHGVKGRVLLYARSASSIGYAAAPFFTVIRFRPSHRRVLDALESTARLRIDPESEEQLQNHRLSAERDERFVQTSESRISLLLARAGADVWEDTPLVARLNKAVRRVCLTRGRLDASRAAIAELEVRSRGAKMAGEAASCVYHGLQALSRIDPTFTISLEHFLPIFRKAVSGAVEAAAAGETPEHRILLADDVPGRDLAADAAFRLFSSMAHRLDDQDVDMFALVVSLRLAHDRGECSPEELRYVSRILTPEQMSALDEASMLGSVGVDPDGVIDSRLGSLAIESAKQLASQYPVKCAIESVPGSLLSDKEAWEPAIAALPGYSLPEQYAGALTPVQKFALRCALAPHALVSHAEEFTASYVSRVPDQSATASLLEASDEAWQAKHPLLIHAADAADESCASAVMRSAFIRRASIAHRGTRVVVLSLGDRRSLPELESALHEAAREGNWVVLQHAHLAPTWCHMLAAMLQLSPAEGGIALTESAKHTALYSRTATTLLRDAFADAVGSGTKAEAGQVDRRRTVHPGFRLFITTPTEMLPSIPGVLRNLCTTFCVCPPKELLSRTMRCYIELGIHGAPPAAANTTYPGAADNALVQDLFAEVLPGVASASGTMTPDGAPIDDAMSLRLRLAMLSLAFTFSALNLRARRSRGLLLGPVTPASDASAHAGSLAWSGMEFVVAARTLRTHMRVLANAEPEEDSRGSIGSIGSPGSSPGGSPEIRRDTEDHSDHHTLGEKLVTRLYDSAFAPRADALGQFARTEVEAALCHIVSSDALGSGYPLAAESVPAWDVDVADTTKPPSTPATAAPADFVPTSGFASLSNALSRLISVVIGDDPGNVLFPQGGRPDARFAAAESRYLLANMRHFAPALRCGYAIHDPADQQSRPPAAIETAAAESSADVARPAVLVDGHALMQAASRLHKLRDAACLAMDAHYNASGGGESGARIVRHHARRFWSAEGAACIETFDGAINALAQYEAARSGTIPATGQHGEIRKSLLRGETPEGWLMLPPGGFSPPLHKWFTASQQRIAQLADAALPQTSATTEETVGDAHSVRLGLLAFPSLLLSAHTMDVGMVPGRATRELSYMITGLEEKPPCDPSSGGRALLIRDARLVGARIDAMRACLMRGGFDYNGTEALSHVWFVPRRHTDDTLLEINDTAVERPRWKKLGQRSKSRNTSAGSVDVRRIDVYFSPNSHVTPGPLHDPDVVADGTNVTLPSRASAIFCAKFAAHIRPEHFAAE